MIRTKQAFLALSIFSLHPPQLEKETAGTLGTQDSAFQEALLKRAFPTRSGAELIVCHQMEKKNNHLHPKSGP